MVEAAGYSIKIFTNNSTVNVEFFISLQVQL